MEQTVSDSLKRLLLAVRLYFLNLRIEKMAVELDDLKASAATLTASVDALLAREAAAPATIAAADLVPVTDALKAAVAKIDAVK